MYSQSASSLRQNIVIAHRSKKPPSFNSYELWTEMKEKRKSFESYPLKWFS